MIDDSQDSTKRQQLILCVKYVSKGVLKEHFLKVIYVENKRGETFHKAVISYLKSKKYIAQINGRSNRRCSCHDTVYIINKRKH